MTLPAMPGYPELTERTRQLIGVLSRRRRFTRSESLRGALKYLRGKRFAPTRKLLRQQLDWHGRWTAEGRALLEPWSAHDKCDVWAWVALGSPPKRQP